jgi:hypothetical protein
MTTSNKMRFFKFEHNNETSNGRFKCENHKEAARRATSVIIKNLGDKYVLGEDVIFNVIDCSNKVSVQYIGSRKLLSNEILSNRITYQYSMKVTEVPNSTKLNEDAYGNVLLNKNSQ